MIFLANLFVLFLEVRNKFLEDLLIESLKQEDVITHPASNELVYLVQLELVLSLESDETAICSVLVLNQALSQVVKEAS